MQDPANTPYIEPEVLPEPPSPSADSAVERLEASLSAHLINKVAARQSPTSAAQEFTGHRLTAAVLRMHLKRFALRRVPASEAAARLGCSKEHARNVYRELRPIVMRELGSILDDTDEQFVETTKTTFELLSEAANKSVPAFLQGLADPESKLTDYQRRSLELKLITDVLDRTPEAAKHTNIHSTNIAINADNLSNAARTAREMDAEKHSPNVRPFPGKRSA